MSDNTEVYLGDGVYAQFDGYHIWIYTSNGIEHSGKIALEPSVVNALMAFGQRFWNRTSTGRFVP